MKRTTSFITAAAVAAAFAVAGCGGSTSSTTTVISASPTGSGLDITTTTKPQAPTSTDWSPAIQAAYMNGCDANGTRCQCTLSYLMTANVSLETLSEEETAGTLEQDSNFQRAISACS
jgi:hypothetical protein